MDGITHIKVGNRVMVAWIGPLATKNCETGQAWKGAAAAVNSCAGVWLVRAAALILCGSVPLQYLTCCNTNPVKLKYKINKNK